MAIVKEISGEILQDKILIHMSGQINSENVPAVGDAIRNIVSQRPDLPVELDTKDLTDISSAGLRLILSLRKTNPDIRITGVNSEIYEILDMTGFTQMMTVTKAYKVVSIEGAEEIGRGANGTIYRIDSDKVVKVYNCATALDDIQYEREVARKALILGLPTAISYDVVRVGDSYGSVFELLNATSFSKIIIREPEKIDWCVKEYTDLLKLIHSTVVPKGELPDIRNTAISWAEFLQDHLPEKAGKKLLVLVKAVPQDDHMIHGDYHTKNVQLVGNEVLMIDMDTISVGHPIFELGSMYNAFVGYSEYDHEAIKQFQGFDYSTGKIFWKKALAAYLGTQNEKKIRDVENKARIIGYSRLIRRSIRRKGLESENGRAEIELWKSELLDLLERTDSLLFVPNEIKVEAKTENLAKVSGFIEAHLKNTECRPSAKMQIHLAVEEIFVNIASYAYYPGTGDTIVRVEVQDDPLTIVIEFIDRGRPFDPLAKDNPDVTLSAEERKIGGLGIFLTRKMMDQIDYQYKDGKNILTLKKTLS